MMYHESANIPLPQQLPDFKAKVRLWTAKEGGRSTPARVGYRPQVWFDIPIKEISCTSGSWQEMESEKLFPGGIAEIGIAILAKKPYASQLFVGLTFRLMEGASQVGEGEILEIYNPALAA